MAGAEWGWGLVVDEIREIGGVEGLSASNWDDWGSHWRVLRKGAT